MKVHEFSPDVDLGGNQMASIRKEVLIEARPENVWAAIRAVGEIHVRLVPGFVVDCRLDGDARIVTFANGLVARELIVDINDDDRRLSGLRSVTVRTTTLPVQVFAEGTGHTRLVWIADPVTPPTGRSNRTMIEQGMAVMKQTLELNAIDG
jgi:hypothetical protein